MQKNKVGVEYKIEGDQQEWLNKAAEEFGLPDDSKALRVLLDFAMEEGNREHIFGQIRCTRCG